MAAAEALARAKVASEIKFGAATAFLSQDDVAIATKLKDIYPNVTDGAQFGRGRAAALQ
jgi:hypothetical protein